jgi:sterol desaturase/sphingolipid hydroxylase (fatty acid hydroxylase superfamily)
VADATVAAIPYYFGTMYAEQRRLKKTQAARGGPGAADYTRPDTLASLSMGVGSLLAPFVAKRVIKAVAPGKSKYGKWLVGAAVSAGVATTVADAVVRRARREGRRSPATRVAEQVQRVGGVATVATSGLALSTAAAIRTNPEAQWRSKGSTRDLGTGPGPWLLAMLGWDFIYYWNHRLQHEVRALWAIHVVHHSSEHYNLSTALRQPVADVMGVFVPYGVMSRAGIRPSLVASARSWNLLYQYWVHTETIDRIGPAEEALSTPSHHRVHHGSNKRYLDRNHGGILIVWDRLFGTFQREDEPVHYGLTKNIHTYNPLRIAGREYTLMARDIAASDNWRDRLSFVLRGPGWAFAKQAERAAAVSL